MIKIRAIAIAFSIVLASSVSSAQEVSVVSPASQSADSVSLRNAINALNVLIAGVQNTVEDKQNQIDNLNNQITDLNQTIENLTSTVADVSSTVGAEECDIEFLEPGTGECLDDVVRDGDAINLSTKNVTIFSENLGLNYTESYTTPWLSTSGDIHSFGSTYKYPNSSCSGWVYKSLNGSFSIHNISSSGFTQVDSFSFSHPRDRDHGCNSFGNTGSYKVKAQRSSDKKKVRLLIEVTSRGDFSGSLTGIWTNNFVISSTQTEIRKAE